MSINDHKKTRRSLMMVILTTLLMSGTATTAALSFQTGSVYGQGQARLTGAQSVLPEEQTFEDVRASRLGLLSGIDNAILRLNGSEPAAGGEFDISHIAELLQTDQLNAAIVELNELKTQVIEVFGQEAADAEVVPQIENLIGALEKQMPSSPSPPPAS
jgi:hypothetical protein